MSDHKTRTVHLKTRYTDKTRRRSARQTCHRVRPKHAHTLLCAPAEREGKIAIIVVMLARRVDIVCNVDIVVMLARSVGLRNIRNRLERSRSGLMLSRSIGLGNVWDRRIALTYTSACKVNVCMYETRFALQLRRCNFMSVYRYGCQD